MNKEIGRRIEVRRKEKGLTLKELADIVGVASSTILRYENGEIKRIKLPVIESIAKALGVDPAWLVLKSNDPDVYVPKKEDVSRIPLLGTIAAGVPTLAEQNIQDHFNLDSKIKADFALKIKGDSMINAGIVDGDIVFIREQNYIENGEIGAILIEDLECEATLKRIYRNENSITLQAENPKYPPKVYTNGNIRILGKLVAVLNMRY